jgi:hypothetical protein
VFVGRILQQNREYVKTTFAFDKHGFHL